MKISIIIPNYNGAEILQQNLPHVLAAAQEYKKEKVEIIIPDDASTDNSKEIIKKFIERITDKNIIVTLIENTNKGERGFSKNVNRGALKATGDILILLNSDVSPQKDFLAPLLKHFENEKVFAVGCLDESMENGKKVLRGRGVGRWQRGFLVHSKGSLDKSNTLWASGGSSAFRKTLWDKLRGLDVLYNPFYWEDIDISYRALKAGYQVDFEPQSIVMHEHEKGSIKTKFKEDRIQKIAYRNQFIFVWKNITDRSLFFSHIFWLPYHFAAAIKGQNWFFFIGFFMALGNLSRILTARERARKLFARTDKAILQEYRV